jgi:hypothetical protein
VSDVKSSQRFTSSNPCPVCGGYDGAERGNGQRCFGFLSDDGNYAHCSREEFARDIALAESSNTYAHYLGGRCRCGSNHGAPSFAQAADGRPRERQRAQFSPERDTVFYYRDLSGTPIYAVVRLGGDKTKTKQAHKADGEWWWGLPSDTPKVPYRLPEVIQGIRDGKTIHGFEGEPDVDEARALGLIATTNLGGAGKFTADIAPYFLGADVVINADADKDGDKHRQDTPRKLMSVAKSIKVMPPFDGVGEGGDFRDWIKNGGTVNEYLEMARAQPFFTPGAPRPVGTLIADVESRPYRWLWKPRLAFGKINIIDGDPGRGKSMLGLDIAARASSGNPMPDGTLGTRGAERLGVVLLSAEDDLEDTVRPRWLEAGGDETKLLHLFMFEDESGKERIVTIPNNTEVLERAVERMDAGVVIVDPLAAFWSPGVRTDADTEVRQALNPLKDMAERLDVAVILVRHLNKSGGANAIYRGAGSIGIIGAARSGILIGKHPEDDSIRVAAPSKINIAKEAPALTYTIASKSEDEPPKIIWGDEIDLRADELTRPPDEEKRSALEDAQEWLSLRDSPTGQ